MQATLANKAEADSAAATTVAEARSGLPDPLGVEAGMPAYLRPPRSASAANPPPLQRQPEEEEEELLQPKLTIGDANDEYEREADRVADRVMQAPAAGPEAQAPRAKPTQTPPYLQRICAECEDELAQRKAAANGAGIRPAQFTRRAIDSPGPGIRLPDAARAKIEPVVASDLGHVRVHDDGIANRAAGEINARAFTHGSHIYLGAGESANDLGLMAHETTHVVQQGQGREMPAIQRRPIDFRVTGRHPDSASLAQIAFFDFASARLHPDERAKVDSMALPADRDLELRGFASEEGDATANAALVDRRIDSVESRLLAQGHDAAHLSDDPRPAEGANQIDYRRWRAVEMFESGATPRTPECASLPEFETPCDSEDAARIRDGISRARDMITETISQLGDPVAFPAAQGPFNQLFTGSAITDVTDGLTLIHTQLGTYGANLPLCATICHSDCDDTLAYNDPEHSPDAMIVCPSFHSFGDADYCAVTLLHEASHATPGMRTDDLAYEGDRLLDQLNSLEALDNADSYTLLVYLVHHPGGLSIGPATPDTTNITDPGELGEISAAIARVEQWITVTTSEAQSLYSEIRDARDDGAWTDPWYEIVMNIASNRFPLTAPPAVPVVSDQENVAAIYDRFDQMSSAVGQVLDINKRPGSLARWQQGPGTDVGVSQNFFGRDPEDQIERLLAALIRATPNITTAFHPRYLAFIKDIRTMNSLGP